MFYKLLPLKAIIILLVLIPNIGIATNGKAIYNSTCIVCHNADPRKAGSVGPELVPSSFELLKLKITKSTYPKDYKPRRKTKIMPTFYLTDKQIKALETYINNFK